MPDRNIGWYNGWSPEERLATLPIQREAIRSGQLAKPETCSICGSGEQVWLHDERYDRPLEAYAVCRVCHRLLHGRFDAPAVWLDLVARYDDGKQWFGMLSIDPDCQRRPFAATYLDGLPNRGDRAESLLSKPAPGDGRHRRTGLSKSRIALFEQCPRRLWLSVHRPELAQEDTVTSAIMRTGHEVGAIACALYPEGHMIDAERGLSAAAAETAALLANDIRQPIFEATFIREDVLVRVDLLLPGERGWHVAEVKSTTGVKEYHLADLATQLWVMQASGVAVESASIRHLDRTFVLHEQGDFAGLLTDTPVDEAVAPLVAMRDADVAQARQAIAGSEPKRDVGAHCHRPFACSFHAHCSAGVIEPDWPVALLPDMTGKRVAKEWADRGMTDLLQVPADAVPGDKLRRIHQATLTGRPFHNPAAIVAETAAWSFPRTFLDFETIQFAVPRWLGTRPFEQVPFQFSAHVQQADGRLEHQAFLSIDGNDPRRACAEALATLPSSGAVIAWNASFERGCLLVLAARYPDLAPALRGLADRLVDLLPVVRRHYYHRDMRGSWSIKAVLPTVAPDLGYDMLQDVRSGTEAQAAWLEAIDATTAPDRHEQLRLALLAYCERDTLGVLHLLDRLVRPLAQAHQ